MPIHDWTRVPAGIFHHLHGTWLFELAGELNEGILPAGYYALGEQVMSGAVPDVLTLERQGPLPAPASFPENEAQAASSEPTATLTAVAADPSFPPRPRVIAIRHVTGDRVVAIVEIVSPGNKRDAAELGALVEKTVVSLSKGIHLVLIDLHPPGAFDADGLHNVIWRELGQEPTAFYPERPLAFVSYVAAHDVKAYIEPRSVGEQLPAVPLFLSVRKRVSLPLESSYRKAFAKVPAHLREVLQA
ncbi:MAG: DUF4058 family protein [Planctomycetes bacterium]|nr:DUF4058 family protein [Planctomycetota bacterium]